MGLQENQSVSCFPNLIKLLFNFKLIKEPQSSTLSFVRLTDLVFYVSVTLIQSNFQLGHHGWLKHLVEFLKV